MAESEQALLCSFGLTKTLDFMLFYANSLIIQKLFVSLQPKCRNNQLVISYAFELQNNEIMAEVNNLQDWVTSEMVRQSKMILSRHTAISLTILLLHHSA